VAEEQHPAITDDAGPREHGTIISEGFVWSGALPMPVDLARYEAWYPGITKVLVQEQIAQSTHRRALEHRAVFTATTRAMVGLIGGIIALLALIGVAALGVVQGQEGAGILLAGATLLAGASTYLFGQRQQRVEREKREKAIERVLAERADT